MSVKRLVLFFAFVVIVWGSYLAVRARNNEPVETKMVPAPMMPVPVLSFYGTSSDTQMSFNQFKGKVVLINLWATWCPPCVQELPSLDRLQKMLPASKFQVVAISVDTAPSIQTVIDFFQKHHIKNLTPYWDKDRQIALKWPYGGLPTSFLVDPNGYVIKQYDGPYEWDKGYMLSEIEGQLR